MKQLAQHCCSVTILLCSHTCISSLCYQDAGKLCFFSDSGWGNKRILCVHCVFVAPVWSWSTKLTRSGDCMHPALGQKVLWDVTLVPGLPWEENHQVAAHLSVPGFPPRAARCPLPAPRRGQAAASRARTSLPAGTRQLLPAGANKSQPLCRVAPPLPPVKGPFLCPGNVILHHPIPLQTPALLGAHPTRPEPWVW